MSHSPVLAVLDHVQLPTLTRGRAPRWLLLIGLLVLTPACRRSHDILEAPGASGGADADGPPPLPALTNCGLGTARLEELVVRLGACEGVPAHGTLGAIAMMGLGHPDEHVLSWWSAVGAEPPGDCAYLECVLRASTCDEVSFCGLLGSSGDCAVPGALRCNGALLERCRSDGVWYGLADCGALGGDCRASDEGPIGCELVGPPCPPDAPVRWCDGDALVRCTPGGAVWTHCDEAVVGTTCQPLLGGESGSIACLDPGSECTVLATPETLTCTSGTLDLCFAGRRTTIDCSAYGYTCDAYSCSVAPMP